MLLVRCYELCCAAGNVFIILAYTVKVDIVKCINVQILKIREYLIS